MRTGCEINWGQIHFIWVTFFASPQREKPGPVLKAILPRSGLDNYQSIADAGFIDDVFGISGIVADFLADVANGNPQILRVS